MTMSVTAFYLACRNGDTATFDSLLPNLSLNDINRIEANGSTALHAASFYGHNIIVSRLLAIGAARNILNKYNNVPRDEAKTPEIELLFDRPNGEERFVEKRAKLEWTYRGDEADLLAKIEYSDTLKRDLKTTVQQIYTFFILRHETYKGKDIIQSLLDDTRENNDVIGLLRLYTAETDFYHELNSALANEFRAFERSRMSVTMWAMSFAGIISRSAELDHLRFQNYVEERVFRGMTVTDNDLEQYLVGEKIMNRSFLSTSKRHEVALAFIKKNTVLGKHSVLCTYKLVDQRAAIELSSVSEFPLEKEVLIVPWLAFKVKHVNRNTVPIQIDLEQLPMINIH